MHGREDKAEELLRHAMTALDFVEGDHDRETFEGDICRDLAQILLETDRYEETGRLILRLRGLTPTGGGEARVSIEVVTLSCAVRFQARRGDVALAVKEMEVPSDPISHPHPPSSFRNPDPTSHL